MVQVKFFTKLEGHFQQAKAAANEIEAEITEWLKQNPDIKIINIQQSSSGGSFGPSKLWVSVWYE